MNKNENIRTNNERLIHEIGTICLVTGLAIGVFAVTREIRTINDHARPVAGDTIKILSASGDRAPYVAKARLPNGETCSIGTGPLAESGGVVNVLNRSNVDAEDQATVILSWESTGKSVMQGADCGHTAELTMSENELIYLRTAATEFVSEFPSILQ